MAYFTAGCKRYLSQHASFLLLSSCCQPDFAGMQEKGMIAHVGEKSLDCIVRGGLAVCSDLWEGPANR